MTNASPLAPGGARWAFGRYQAVRRALPKARFPSESLRVADLSEVFDRYDGFILDAYGVLNVGGSAVPGAPARVDAMRAAGRRIVVLTNGASRPPAVALEGYARFGFDFAPDEVVSSRELARNALLARGDGRLWAAIAPAGAVMGDLAPLRVALLTSDPALLTLADGFLFLASQGWTDTRQQSLAAALAARPRPVVVANPDIVAPLEHGLSLEPGHFGHALAEIPGVTVHFHGKPFGPALGAALDRLGGLDPARVAMVGDTLHTDVLGGRAAGLGTVLVTGHGLFRGLDADPFIEASGIVPDVIAAGT